MEILQPPALKHQRAKLEEWAARMGWPAEALRRPLLASRGSVATDNDLVLVPDLGGGVATLGALIALLESERGCVVERREFTPVMLNDDHVRFVSGETLNECVIRLQWRRSDAAPRSARYGGGPAAVMVLCHRPEAFDDLWRQGILYVWLAGYETGFHGLERNEVWDGIPLLRLGASEERSTRPLMLDAFHRDARPGPGIYATSASAR